MNTSQADTATGEGLLASAGGRAGQGKKKVTNRRILATVAVVAALVHVGQVVSGGHPWAGIVSFGLAAAFVVGWRLELLKAVRTAVVLLGMLSLACILGTLTVQRSQMSHASPEEFQSTAAFAWAHLAIKVTHPFPGEVEPGAAQADHLDRLEAVFGADGVSEERKKLHKSLVAGQHEEKAQALAAAHPEVFAGIFRLADALLLTDVFHAWWFVSLFYLLSLNLVVGALIRRKPSVRNLGFHAAHLGLVLVVLGATIGGFLGQRGFVPLTVGKGSSAFTDRANGAEVPLGFSVRLDRFETLYHEDLVVEAGSGRPSSPHHGMMGGGDDALREEFKLEVGRVIPLTDPASGEKYELRMLEIDEAAGVGRTFAAGPDEGDAEPAVRLLLPGGPADGVWISGHETVFVDPDNRYKVRLERSDSASGGDVAPICPAERTGTFTLDSGGSNPSVVPVVAGASAVAGEFQLTFLEVTPSFRVGASEIDARAYPRNPAARIRMDDREGRAGDFLFFSDPQLRDFTELPWAGMSGTFDYDFWCSPTDARIRIEVARDGSARASVAADGEPTAPAIELAQGAPLVHEALPDGIELVEALAAAHAVVEPIRAASSEEPRQTLLRLGIQGPQGEDERWLLSNSPTGSLVLGDGGLTVHLEDNRARPPRDWRSHLAILEEGQVVHEGVAEVNGPVTFGGYAFFQSDADPSRPDYSGLQVVRDPAWLPVKTGLWSLLLGIGWIFYVQPVMDRKRGGPQPESREGGQR